MKVNFNEKTTLHAHVILIATELFTNFMNTTCLSFSSQPQNLPEVCLTLQDLMYSKGIPPTEMPLYIVGELKLINRGSREENV